MNILIEFSPGGSESVRGGWLRAFNAAGHSCSFFNPHIEPAFDAFDRVFGRGEGLEGIYLGTTYGLSRDVMACLSERPALKVALFASAWGHLVDNLDPSLYPIDRVKEEEKKNMDEVRPDFVFIHCVPSALEGVLGGWKSLGVKIASVLNGADTVLYRPGKYRRELSCDGCFVGGVWGYKERNIRPFLYPLCSPDSPLHLKIFGRSRWPCEQYIGTIAPETERDLYVSARVCLNIHEPHSTEPTLGYDIVERPYKTAACGGIVVSDYVKGMDEVFGKGMVAMADNPSGYRDLVYYWAREASEQMRQAYANCLRGIVLSSHTYFDRAATLMTHLGLPDAAKHLLEVKDERNCLLRPD